LLETLREQVRPVMFNSSTNLRKAAVLVRSADADTAATLLAQLSMEEATALRLAMRELGTIDPEEQADVLAEFRRGKPLAGEPANRGVELSLSSPQLSDNLSPPFPADNSTGKRFEFLDSASPKTLASYLAREHVQTIAVVLSHLPPSRAASVLSSLPERLQAEAMERLSNLGDADSDAVAMLETELAAWLKSRSGNAGDRTRRHDAVTSILAAANATTRDAIVGRLRTTNPELAERVRPLQHDRARSSRSAQRDEYRVVRSTAQRHQVNKQLGSLIRECTPPETSATLPPPSPTAAARIDFAQLIHIDSRMLAQLLEVADPNLMALALAGSNDDLVERICDQMPKRISKAFRRELRQMGPTRLSDVEAAQRAIADLASRQIAVRRGRTIHST
jgi:flagellar motor switch protein FliG